MTVLNRGEKLYGIGGEYLNTIITLSNNIGRHFFTQNN